MLAFLCVLNGVVHNAALFVELKDEQASKLLVGTSGSSDDTGDFLDHVTNLTMSFL
jgi:hypothetical protein